MSDADAEIYIGIVDGEMGAERPFKNFSSLVRHNGQRIVGGANDGKKGLPKRLVLPLATVNIMNGAVTHEDTSRMNANSILK